MKIELRQEIDNKLDRLIEDGRNLVDTTKVYAKDNDRKPKEVEETQMRNLLEMAIATDSVEALKLFAQYQVGRGKLPRKFGEQLIQNIDEKLGALADEVSQKYQADKKEILLRLVRQYLGYMNRYFKYRKEFPEEREE